MHSWRTKNIHRRLMGPSPCPLGLNGVFWGSIIPRYLLMAGPVALESTKEKNIVI